MSLTMEVVFELFGVKDEATFRHLQSEANHDINTLDPAWFENLVERIAKAKGVDRAAAEKLVQILIASSDAVRYTRLGNPETIVIDDGSIAEKIIETRENGRQIGTN